MSYDQIQEAVLFIRNRTDFQPSVGIILGTGLGGIAEELEQVAAFSYAEIPHFPVSTVQGHSGKLILGKLSGVNVVVMAGRVHFYEGYSMQQVTFPVRVMKYLGVERLIVSNASGSVNPGFEIGDLVFIKDHINLLPENPLRVPNDERLGVRFPDMLHAYDREMTDAAASIAVTNGIKAKTGIFVAFQGPNLETPAEYSFLHRIGGDIVGMSTVPEVIVAKHSGIKVLAVSIVTDVGFPPEAIRETSLEDVLSAARKAEPKLRLVIKQLLEKYRR